jgi:hypothetical protein
MRDALNATTRKIFYSMYDTALDGRDDHDCSLSTLLQVRMGCGQPRHVGSSCGQQLAHDRRHFCPLG